MGRNLGRLPVVGAKAREPSNLSFGSYPMTCTLSSAVPSAAIGPLPSQRFLLRSFSRCPRLGPTQSPIAFFRILSPTPLLWRHRQSFGNDYVLRSIANYWHLHLSKRRWRHSDIESDDYEQQCWASLGHGVANSGWRLERRRHYSYSYGVGRRCDLAVRNLRHHICGSSFYIGRLGPGQQFV